MLVFDDYHRTVVGFHGTSLARATSIVQRSSWFTPSRNDFDWLGHGVYFWEHAPLRAWEWARSKYAERTKIAVLGAMIRLGRCFDLLEPANARLLERLHRQYGTAAEEAGELPRRNANAKKYLDCATMQYACQVFEDEDRPLDTIRAVFVPSGRKERLWERSGLFHNAHIQLCVRNVDCVLGAWLVPEPTAYYPS